MGRIISESVKLLKERRMWNQSWKRFTTLRLRWRISQSSVMKSFTPSFTMFTRINNVAPGVGHRLKSWYLWQKSTGRIISESLSVLKERGLLLRLHLSFPSWRLRWEGGLSSSGTSNSTPSCVREQRNKKRSKIKRPVTARMRRKLLTIVYVKRTCSYNQANNRKISTNFRLILTNGNITCRNTPTWHSSLLKTNDKG